MQIHHLPQGHSGKTNNRIIRNNSTVLGPHNSASNDSGTCDANSTHAVVYTRKEYIKKSGKKIICTTSTGPNGRTNTHVKHTESSSHKIEWRGVGPIPNEPCPDINSEANDIPWARRALEYSPPSASNEDSTPYDQTNQQCSQIACTRVLSEIASARITSPEVPRLSETAFRRCAK